VAKSWAENGEIDPTALLRKMKLKIRSVPLASGVQFCGAFRSAIKLKILSEFDQQILYSSH